MTVLYKSKDTDYMNRLKRAVLNGMPERHPNEKSYTWHYIQKQIMMDDLQAFAIQKLQKTVYFPTQSFNGKVMLVFKTVPDELEMETIDKMIEAMKMKAPHVYLTALHKIDTPNEEEQLFLHEVLMNEIKIIGPEKIISFGVDVIESEKHFVHEHENFHFIKTHEFTSIFQQDGGKAKKQLWNDIVNCLKYGKAN